MSTIAHRANLLFCEGSTNMRHLFILLMTILAIITTMVLSSSVLALGVNGNPWGYSFVATGGRLIYAPNRAFCSGQYFHCIPSFPRGVGYVVECRDGLFSKSGGRPGSCSKHGGDGAILYSHSKSGNPVQIAKPSQFIPATRPVFISGSSSSTSLNLPLTGSDPQ